MKLVTTRDITPYECHWLNKTVRKGSEVFEYHRRTYGCISPDGVAVTLQDGVDPFFELPSDALESGTDHNDDLQVDFARMHMYGDAIRALISESPHMCTEDGVTKLLPVLEKLELAFGETIA